MDPVAPNDSRSRSRSPARAADVSAPPEVSPKIADVVVRGVRLRDIRFPTSADSTGSDARSKDPDYSCVYCELTADGCDSSIVGVGIAFSLGRGNELLLQAAELLKRNVVGLPLRDCAAGFGSTWRKVSGAADGQLLWMGPEKCVVHQASACLVNALWDLWAKCEGKPLWRLVSDLPSEQLVSALDLTDVTDVLSPQTAHRLLARGRDADAASRLERLLREGLPAYTTATGWAGYSDDLVRQLVGKAKMAGFKAFKMKVGLGEESDCRRAKILREEIGEDLRLMMDANSVWSVQEAIRSMRKLAQFRPVWIEEPCHPDDILGHLDVQRGIGREICVAGGEQTANRVMMKQFLKSGAYTVCQQDAVKVAGLNEWLVSALMAKVYDVPVCVHAGGVGLCNMAAHLGAIDALVVSKHEEEGIRMHEYIDHLEEHFLFPPIVKNGRYMAPVSHGWGLDMKPDSLGRFEWPSGGYWKDKPEHFANAGQ